MLESIKQYPLLWILMLVLLGLAIAVLLIARKNKKAAGDSPELLLSAKDVEKLRTSFSNLTAEKLGTVHGKEMIYAVITNIESKLDNGKAFEQLSRPQQQAYTLWYFSQTATGPKGMCQFFREFEQPLTGLIVPALMELNEAKLAGIVNDAFHAFDENNEAASCDQKTVGGLNEAFKSAFDRVSFYDETEAYIRANLTGFLDA